MGALRVSEVVQGGGALFRSAEPSVRVGVDKRPSAAHRPRGDPVRLNRSRGAALEGQRGRGVHGVSRQGTRRTRCSTAR
jgi:hypothetical protein